MGMNISKGKLIGKVKPKKSKKGKAKQKGY